jgi:hypothetical protein
MPNISKSGDQLFGAIIITRVLFSCECAHINKHNEIRQDYVSEQKPAKPMFAFSKTLSWNTILVLVLLEHSEFFGECSVSGEVGDICMKSEELPVKNAYQGIRPSINCLTDAVITPTRTEYVYGNLTTSFARAARALAECGVLVIDSLWDRPEHITELNDFVNDIAKRCTDMDVCTQNSIGLVEIDLEDVLLDSTFEHLSAQMKKILPIILIFLENSFRIEMVGAFHRTESPHYQRWHADCAQVLFRDVPVQLPPSCIVLFVPLVRCDNMTGCTEFLTGSHLMPDLRTKDDLFLFAEDDEDDPQWRTVQDDNKTKLMDPEYSGLSIHSPMSHLRLNVSAGSFILYDYRTVHRAGLNQMGKARNMIEVNYCRNWYRDICNQ